MKVFCKKLAFSLFRKFNIFALAFEFLLILSFFVDNKKISNKFGYMQHKHSHIYGLHVCWALTSRNVKKVFVVQEPSLLITSHQSLEV